MTESRQGRKVEAQIEINAPVEAVWKALTDGEELTRWFPREARVTPGQGGSYWISWGGDMGGESRIEVWEPNRHLRTVVLEGPWVSEKGAAPPAPIAIDYYLETRGGKTTLRLVHSGFGSGADWDEEYEGVKAGWAFELRGLRHYVERHRGTPRRVVWVEMAVAGSKADLWQQLSTLLPGLGQRAWQEGDRYSFQASTGDRFQGTVMNFGPPKGFSGTVENMNGAVLRLLVEKCGGLLTASVWFSLYGLPEEEVRQLEERWTRVMQQTFPGAERVQRPLAKAAA